MLVHTASIFNGIAAAVLLELHDGHQGIHVYTTSTTGTTPTRMRHDHAAEGYIIRGDISSQCISLYISMYDISSLISYIDVQQIPSDCRFMQVPTGCREEDGSSMQVPKAVADTHSCSCRCSFKSQKELCQLACPGDRWDILKF